MNGVINIYKEKGYTSFHVIYELRKLTGEQKVGHTGTLDPDVTGVLPVCIGKATKLVGQLTDSDKTYKCRMLFGKSTDTQDASGRMISSMSPDRIEELLLSSVPSGSNIKELIRDTILGFEGEINQIPPMYSALKVDGMKLVNAARKGVEVERKPRKVTIYSIEDISISEDLLHADFTVNCSKGTYIRTLCEDIGKRLNIPACMESLERIKAAGLTLDTAITLDEAKELDSRGELERFLIPSDRFFTEYLSVSVTDDAVKRLIYGNYMYEKDIVKFPEPIAGGQIFRIYDLSGNFYALYRYDDSDRCFKCIKMFI